MLECKKLYNTCPQFSKADEDFQITCNEL